MTDENKKFCKRCMTWLPLTAFYKRGKTYKYKHGYCKLCHKQSLRHTKVSCPHCGCWIRITAIDETGKVVNRKRRPITIRESKNRYKDVTVKPEKSVKDFLK